MAQVVEKLGVMGGIRRVDFGQHGIHRSGNAAEAASSPKLPGYFLANGFGNSASSLRSSCSK
jgi:hypothetical protein